MKKTQQIFVEVEYANEDAAVVYVGVISDSDLSIPTFGTVMPGTFLRKMKGHVSQGTTHPLQPAKYVTLRKSCGHLAWLSA